MGRNEKSILALAGGVGGAKLVLGLSKILSPHQLTVIVNTGDDEEFHGLHISPDLDTVMYTLAGLSNPETGWGMAEESFHSLAMLSTYGAPTWFSLGDKDLATHIRRTELMNSGLSLSEVTQNLCGRLGIRHLVAPMSDDFVRTTIDTNKGPLAFQEYFVHLRCEPKVESIKFQGAESAQPSPMFADALRSATALVYCPSNPFLSIDPILAVGDVRNRIKSFEGIRIAVSPIIAGQALRGPAAKLLAEMGQEVSTQGIASHYKDLCDILVMDTSDAALTQTIQSLGIKPYATNTIMKSDEDKVALAKYICNLMSI